MTSTADFGALGVIPVIGPMLVATSPDNETLPISVGLVKSQPRNAAIWAMMPPAPVLVTVGAETPL